MYSLRLKVLQTDKICLSHLTLASRIELDLLCSRALGSAGIALLLRCLWAWPLRGYRRN